MGIDVVTSTTYAAAGLANTATAKPMIVATRLFMLSSSLRSRGGDVLLQYAPGAACPAVRGGVGAPGRFGIVSTRASRERPS
jgi:hypothetical protein